MSEKNEAAKKAEAEAKAKARPVAAYDIMHGVEGPATHYAPDADLSGLSEDELADLDAKGCVRWVVPGDVDAEGGAGE